MKHRRDCFKDEVVFKCNPGLSNILTTRSGTGRPTVHFKFAPARYKNLSRSLQSVLIHNTNEFIQHPAHWHLLLPPVITGFYLVTMKGKKQFSDKPGCLTVEIIRSNIEWVGLERRYRRDKPGQQGGYEGGAPRSTKLIRQSYQPLRCR